MYGPAERTEPEVGPESCRIFTGSPELSVAVGAFHETKVDVFSASAYSTSDDEQVIVGGLISRHTGTIPDHALHDWQVLWYCLCGPCPMAYP